MSIILKLVCTIAFIAGFVIFLLFTLGIPFCPINYSRYDPHYTASRGDRIAVVVKSNTCWAEWLGWQLGSLALASFLLEYMEGNYSKFNKLEKLGIYAFMGFSVFLLLLGILWH